MGTRIRPRVSKAGQASIQSPLVPSAIRLGSGLRSQHLPIVSSLRSSQGRPARGESEVKGSDANWVSRVGSAGWASRTSDIWGFGVYFWRLSCPLRLNFTCSEVMRAVMLMAAMRRVQTDPQARLCLQFSWSCSGRSDQAVGGWLPAASHDGHGRWGWGILGMGKSLF